MWTVRVTIIATERQHCLFVCYSATCHCQQYKDIECYTTILLWPIYVTGNNKKNAGLHVKCPIVLYDFNQIWISSKDFHKSPQYQVSRKSVRWDPRSCMRTDGRTSRRFSALTDVMQWPRRCKGHRSLAVYLASATAVRTSVPSSVFT